MRLYLTYHQAPRPAGCGAWFILRARLVRMVVTIAAGAAYSTNCTV